MKNFVVAIAATIVAGASAVHAAPFNGYSIGLKSGVDIRHIQSSRLERGMVVLGMSGKSSTKIAGLFGMEFAHENSKPNSLYWGVGIDFNLYATGAKNTQILPASFDFTINGVRISNYTVRVENRQRYSSNLDFRLGYNFCNQAVLYGVGGFKLSQERTKIFLSFTATQGGQSTGKQRDLYNKIRTQLVPLVGVGAAYKVTNNISVGPEYRYSFSIKRMLRGGKGATLLKLKTGNSHAIRAKVDYHV